MERFIDLIESEKAYWLFELRYALVTWPFILGGITASIGLGKVSALFFLLSILFGLKLAKLKLLPHEKKRLSQVSSLLSNVQPAEAVQLLEKSLQFSSFHYDVKRRSLLSRSYICQGDFVKAHEVLNHIKNRHLSIEEHVILNTAWAELFLEVDNLEEAESKLNLINEKNCQSDLSCFGTCQPHLNQFFNN